ncbi:hypothetical protein [Nostoc sp. MS1]|uniref:hypothetical protein n=1 Tax=Nostoc sp. MS1 TaxID=2764711 RepID=UPI001CC7C543|nr:hypothetical protein [Nostoc sp. MS1]BCL38503.1 hypothetical protein NSMS1_49500 [Nostoc sp. MS1]
MEYTHIAQGGICGRCGVAKRHAPRTTALTNQEWEKMGENNYGLWTVDYGLMTN